MHIKCQYFSQKNLATGGLEPPPPQMPLTVINLAKLLKVRGPCDFSKKFQAKLNKISEISIKRMKNIDKNEQISTLTTYSEIPNISSPRI